MLDRWIHDHIPAAIRLAEELEQSGTDDRFVFMAHVRDKAFPSCLRLVHNALCTCKSAFA